MLLLFFQMMRGLVHYISSLTWTWQSNQSIIMFRSVFHVLLYWKKRREGKWRIGIFQKNPIKIQFVLVGNFRIFVALNLSLLIYFAFFIIILVLYFILFYSIFLFLFLYENVYTFYRFRSTGQAKQSWWFSVSFFKKLYLFIIFRTWKILIQTL